MTEIYGPKFTNAYGENPNSSWAAIFAGMTGQDIARGFKRLTAHDSKFKVFVPTAFEFRELCSPDSVDYGLPSEPEAFKIAANWANGSVGKNPAVLHAIRQLDFYQWSRLPTEKAKKEFSSAWKNTVLHVMGGGELDQIVQDDHRIEKKPLSKDEKKAMSEKIAEFKKGLSANRLRKQKKMCGGKWLETGKP